MEKRVFRSKIVYWVSFLFFSISFFILIFALFFFYNDFSNSIYVFFISLILIILNTLILFFLFRKDRKSVFYINIFIGIIILLISLTIFSEIGIDSRKSEILILAFFDLIFIFYLFLVNYFKVKPNDIKDIKEIDEIGKQ